MKKITTGQLENLAKDMTGNNPATAKLAVRKVGELNFSQLLVVGLDYPAYIVSAKDWVEK